MKKSIEQILKMPRNALKLIFIQKYPSLWWKFYLLNSVFSTNYQKAQFRVFRAQDPHRIVDSAM